MLKYILQKVTDRQDLTDRESAYMMNQIMQGSLTDVALGGFLTAMETKRPSEDELVSFAKTMRHYSRQVTCDLDVFDIVGTGGGAVKTFNISTTSAFVIAAGGVLVAKHGNRAKTSRSGSADMLEALGVNIFLSPESCVDMLKRIGICYFYTRYYYYMMKRIDAVRQDLGIHTFFDVLRPLTNPAHAAYEVLGVDRESLVTPMAHVLSWLGTKRGMVVYGHDGTDEISAAAPTTICEFSDGTFRKYVIEPAQFNLPPCQGDDLKGGTARENAAIARDILKGKRMPCRSAILLNAGAGLYIGGKADSLATGVKMARVLIDSGLARKKLDEFIVASQKMREIEKIRISSYRDEEDMI